jgi:hypothetical protein
MKFLDRIGLAKNIEIPISTSVEVFEQQLLNFKNSNTDKFGFLYSNKFYLLILSYLDKPF